MSSEGQLFLWLMEGAQRLVKNHKKVLQSKIEVDMEWYECTLSVCWVFMTISISTSALEWFCLPITKQ